MSKLIALMLLLYSTTSMADNHFLLSGEIKASENQVFYSPKTDNWRVQIQWMLPEGEVAEKGDLVVVFDSGSIQSQIEQEEVSLESAEEQLHRLNSEAKQKLMEANFGYKRAELLLEKARIDAGISKEHLSLFDYEKNQFSLEEAIIAKAKSAENLAQIKVSNQVSITKQELKIQKHKDKLNYNRNKLSKMSLYAERSGPVLYGDHPWNGEKIFVGMTAQPSWKIAEIPSANGLFVEAWVHEVDVKNLAMNKKAKITFDAYPQQVFVATLNNISTQPEERKEWGSDVYYRSVFNFDTLPELPLIPGMSVQLEMESAGGE